MKKNLLIFLLAFTVCFGYSQNTVKSIGIRGGYAYINGPIIEATYQLEYKFLRRFELDLGMSFNRTYIKSGICIMHQWRFILGKSWSWYFGAGLSIGYWDYSIGYHDFDDDGFFIGFAPNVGIEYLLPKDRIKISLDIRPEVGLYNNPGEDFSPQAALALRYNF